MRNRCILLTFAFILSCSYIKANSKDIRSHLDSLITMGNRAYEQSQRTKIKLYADSISEMLRTNDLAENALLDYTVAMNKLYGNYHYENASLDSAEYYYSKAKNIIDKNPYTDFHGNDLLMLRELAQLYYRIADYEKAAKIMAEADDKMEYNGIYLSGDDNWLTTKMTYAICLARLGEFDKALSIANTELGQALNKSGLTHAKSERIYAKILLLANANKDGALKAYRSYFSTQKKYAMENFSRMTAKEREEYWHILYPFITDCYKLEDTDPSFLFDVTLFSKGILLQVTSLSGADVATEKSLQSLNYRWQDIQKKLKSKQAAIEFVQYEKDGSQCMGALVLKHEGKPQFIRLTPPAKIIDRTGKSLSSTTRTDKDKLYNDTCLQSLVWTEQLMNSLTGITRLYFSPDGYMHRLAIEYMPQVADIEVFRLTSTRRLMESESRFSFYSPALLCGGINYELDKTDAKEMQNDALAYKAYSGKYFSRLNDKTNETKNIYALRNNNYDTLLSASKASENVFRLISPHYHSIIISTHGDFCAIHPISTDMKPVLNDESMSQNIIAFAGVNSHLKDLNFNPSTNCDGLLSAKELSSLNLSKCELFTISACQSALGEITSDGVFGLQRGLKNAGVKTMLLSLWNVNSDATAILMREFYSNLNDGKTLRQAFKLARESLLKSDTINNIGADSSSYIFDPATMANKAVRNNKLKYDTPQFTNAFIMIDALD